VQRNRIKAGNRRRLEAYGIQEICVRTLQPETFVTLDQGLALQQSGSQSSWPYAFLAKAQQIIRTESCMCAIKSKLSAC
jgi:hypothetical protein